MDARELSDLPIGSLLEAQACVVGASVEVVTLALRQPLTLPFATVTDRPSLIVALDLEVNGVQARGYGEGASLAEPFFTDDYTGNLHENAMTVVAALEGHRLPVRALVDLIAHAFDPAGLRYPTARFAVEMAMLDGLARTQGLSVRDLFGVGATRRVPFGKSIGVPTSTAAIEAADRALASGARKIKLKISPELFPEIVVAARELAARTSLMLDANGTFDPTDATHLDMLRELDTLGLIMIEEPVSRCGPLRGIDAVRTLRDAIAFETPICLDDCVRTIADVDAILNEDLAEIINLKPARVGSLLLSLEIARRAARTGHQVMVGGMLESTLGRCATGVLGAYCDALGFTIPGDLSLPEEALAEELPNVKPVLYYDDGAIVLPSGPGFGI